MQGCAAFSTCWWVEKLALPVLSALIAIAIATVVGYFFTERWQRARQQRDLQFRTITELSARIDRVIAGLTELFYAARTDRVTRAELTEMALNLQREIGGLTSELARFYVFEDAELQRELMVFADAANSLHHACLDKSGDDVLQTSIETLLDRQGRIHKRAFRDMGLLSEAKEARFEAVAEDAAKARLTR